MISIWEEETFFSPQDVIIIGSGFTGLWSAFYLKQKNSALKITIIERGMIPAGASTRNAGFACFGSSSELVYDAQTMGTDNMLQLVEMRYKGIKTIEQYFANKIDYEPCGGYELYNAIDTEELGYNIDTLNGKLQPITGTTNTFKKVDDKIKAFGFGQTKHIVENSLEGALHSGKLLQALLIAVQSMGVQVITGTEVTSFEQEPNNLAVYTNQQITFTTAQILVCTNAFTPSLLPTLSVTPARGQVILTSQIPHLPFKGTFHADEGYYYFRHLGNRVLLGGARNKAFEAEETTATEITPVIQNELEHYLSQVILPGYTGQYTIERRWSGIMAMGAEKMPIIQQVQPNVYCAVRMSGMGVALAPVAGNTVASMMLAH